MRTCVTCGKVREDSMFNHDSNTKGGISSKCKHCVKASYIKSKYGLSIDAYIQLYNKQNGCCAICGVHQDKLPDELYIDHDHQSGKVRGLLCPNCNSGIGHLGDCASGVRKALEYLENSENK